VGFNITSNIIKYSVQPAVLFTCTTAVANKSWYLSQFIELKRSLLLTQKHL